MTDLLDDPAGELLPPPVDLDDPGPLECQQPHCTNPAEGRGANCIDHKGKRAPKPGDDGPPAQIHIPNAPRVTRKDQRATEVAEGAEAMLGLVVMGIGLTGDAVCTEAWKRALPQIAAQLGELSKYHPGLAKVFVSSGVGGEGAVWVGLGLAVAPALLATLSHHHMLPDAIASRIAGVAVEVVAAADGAGAAA